MILSVQSLVSYGHAGNSSAVFPLQRLGFEVIQIPTVVFSNDTSYPSVHGMVLDAAQITDIVSGLDEIGVLASVNAVLSGYLGTAEMGNAVLETIEKVHRYNPKAFLCVDPVMGDLDTGFYCKSEVKDFFCRNVEKFNVLTPNLFELGTMTNTKPQSVSEVVNAARSLLALGPEAVVVTSAGGTKDARMIAVDASGQWMVSTPKLDRKFSGCGDVTTAILLARLQNGDDLSAALSHTASAVYGILRNTSGRQLALVQAQNEIVAPSIRFEATAI
ncbi:pyridoxal kinase [Propionimicrobium lymphophilum]|uniref:pyridoxal kinase n=1 Tax=Propionimicrobium lymphophilum TaxID=33012 RepID=UPI0023F3888D|nr:pyridoxal kinase [Propionimicrobium lymphophilum]